MSNIILSIITATITTSIGILAGRRMKTYDLREEVVRQQKRLAMTKYQSEYFKTQYLKMLRPNYEDLKINLIRQSEELKRRENMEKQAEYKVNRNIKDKQLEIINHYGLKKQLDQLLEESGELIVAIAKTKRYSCPGSSLDHHENLVEELADVKNLIEQIELSNPYIKEGIGVMVKHKVEREIERMKNNN